MAEREIWEVVAERFGLYKKMRGIDGYNLTADLTKEALKGLDKDQISAVIAAHGLKAEKFFNNDEFWANVQEKLKQNE